MAHAGDVSKSQNLVMTIIIGDGRTSEVDSTTFTNPPPEVGEDYYIFIRLYSALDDVSQGGREGGGARLNDRVLLCCF